MPFVGQCFLFLAALALFPTSFSIRRDYYIQATEQWWDYAPSKDNLITNDRRFNLDSILENDDKIPVKIWNHSISDRKISTRDDRIGSVYKKIMLKEFTDGTFTEEIPMPPWMGYIGPLIKGETGDVLYVHFNNLAKRPYSLHPHGVRYFKDGEGALYADGTTGTDKLDDWVQPGQTYTYKWYLTKSFAPTKDDDNCLPLGYHPHVRSPKDIDSGLVGMMTVCKPGTLDAYGNRKDVDKEFVLYVDLVNETNSWLIEDNMERCGNPRRCRQLFMEKNAAFIGDSILYQINGYIFGNLPSFPVHEGERAVFYAFGLNLGSHPVGIQGQSLVVKDMRSHAYAFGAALFEGLYMVPRNPGRWLLFCKRTFHFQQGMGAFVNVLPAKFPLPPAVLSPIVRRHFIAVEEVVWNYLPSGKILARVGQGSEDRSMIEGRFYDHPGAVGGRYVKAIFREYADLLFNFLKPKLKHLGILGPPVKVAVGETLEIFIFNKARRSYSFNPFGLAFTKDNEGAYYKNSPTDQDQSGAIVNPGEIRRYVFTVPPEFGPTKHDPQCITESYQSFVDFTRDMYSGLGGPLLICKPGVLDVKGNQIGVDREFYIMPMVWYELDSWYLNESIALAMQTGKDVDRTVPEFRDVNAMRAFNGLSFGNLKGLDMCTGDRVSWHIFSFGERFELHASIFEGNNLFYEGRRVDHLVVRAGTAETAVMIPDNKGTWLLHSGQLDAQTDGMVTTYNVRNCRPMLTLPTSIIPIRRTVRTYFIAAVDIDWDYLPRNKIHPMTRTDIRETDTPGNLYIRDDDMFIGPRYKKAVYREFIDASFTRMKPRGQRDIHLGILGPFVRLEVGDILEVVYRNMASFNNSITFKGLFIDNMQYAETKIGIPPGGIKVYRWQVPARSGPGSQEPNCIGSNYNSPIYPRRDVASGLVGPLIICRKGILDHRGNRRDNVDREFALGFIIFNEANSHYFDENVRERAPARINRMDSIFRESNLKYTMNGYLFQNIQGLVMTEGETIAWYIFSFGSILGEHTGHFHGLTFVRKTNMVIRDDVVGVVPGSFETVEMFADNPGTWLLHCHVGLHMSAGMNGVYKVLSRNRGDPNQTIRRRVYEVVYNRFDMRYNKIKQIRTTY